MFWALAVILLALAGFTLIVVSVRRQSCATNEPDEATTSIDAGRRIDPEQLRGFVYVGAGALVLLAVAVILMGLFGTRSGRAEGLAVLGLFGYAAYLIAATVVVLAFQRSGPRVTHIDRTVRKEKGSDDA